MPTSHVNGVELDWMRSGEGPPVLFCNGSGSTLRDVRPLLDGLAARFNVLAFDYRGFGRSTSGPNPYRMADLAADAVGLIDLAGWAACRVLGISFGGMVAQELAVTHPDRIARLALLCTSAGGAGGASYPLQELSGLGEAERTARELTLTDSRWDQRWLASHPGDRFLADGILARRGSGRGVSDAARRAQLDARAGHDVWGRLPAISCPTFVGAGRYDGIAPVENGRAIAARIPDAEFHVFEGGHLFLLQDPEASRALDGFLTGPSGGVC